MKKRMIAAMVLSLALLAGCGSKDSDTVNKEAPTSAADNDDTGNKATPTEEPDISEPTAGPIAEPTEETRPVTLFAGYESSEAEILSFLEGEWALHETENMIEPPDMLFDTLTFDSEKMEVTYHMAYAAEEAVYSFSLSDLYPDVPGQYNKLTLRETGTTPDYPYSDGDKQIELTIWLASNGGYDALVIGDVDDTPSHFIKDALGDERKAGDYWYFHRSYENMPGVIRTGNFDESAAVRKSSHFFALQYDEYGSECSLQEVEIVPRTAYLVSGDEEDLVAYGFADNGHPFETVTYRYKGLEQLAHSGAYSPDLVEVETDANGEITSITRYDKAPLGYFRAAMNGAPDAARDPAVYQAMDDRFLGDWNDGGYQDTISISAADPQTGGYYVEIGFYRIGVAECYANIDGDKLVINQGFINEKRIGGELEINKQGNLLLTITESEFEYISAGSVYEYSVRE